jgi:hypothetical protein
MTGMVKQIVIVMLLPAAAVIASIAENLLTQQSLRLRVGEMGHHLFVVLVLELQLLD